MPVASSDEFFLSGELDLYGSARSLGQNSSDGAQPGLVFRTVAGPHILAHDSNVSTRDVQSQRQRKLIGVNATCGLPDSQVIAIPGSDRCARLQSRARMGRRRVRFLEDAVCLSKSFFDAAPGQGQRFSSDEVALRPSLRGVGFDGLHSIGHERQLLVIDLDEAQSGLSQVFVICSHSRHFVADVSDFSIENRHVGRDLTLRSVEWRHRSSDSRKASRGIDVDRQNPGVGIRTPQNLAEQHPWKLNISGVLRLASQLLRQVSSGFRFSDGLECRHVL